MRRYWRSMRRHRSSMRKSHEFTGDIGDCGVGITPQMCIRVTNHGDKSTFSKPVSIQDGVHHGITLAPISTIPAELLPIPAELSPIPAELSLIPAELSPIPEAIGGRRFSNANRCSTH